MTPVEKRRHPWTRFVLLCDSKHNMNPQIFFFRLTNGTRCQQAGIQTCTYIFSDAFGWKHWNHLVSYSSTDPQRWLAVIEAGYVTQLFQKLSWPTATSKFLSTMQRRECLSHKQNIWQRGVKHIPSRLNCTHKVWQYLHNIWFKNRGAGVVVRFCNVN